ncbi:MAG: site-specific integrase, partial [Planctomycetes bacterium]|nr:site-specific integrase [Planctomycetota bacterium]
MPELAYRVPQYRRHRASGQAIVKLSGKTYYLGPHGTEASRAEYDRLVAEWMRNGRRFQRGSTDITVNELLLAYWRFAEGYYRQDGQPTSELNAIRIACRPLRRLYGSTQARDFGPLALKVVREAMVSRGWVRTSVNHHIVRIRRLFKWAAENEMIPPDVHSALTKVSGLKRGRTAAPESSPVRPVPAAHVAAVLPHVSAQVRAMIEILRLTAMRPAEVTLLRTADLQRGAPVWTYTLARHKLTHLGRPRAVYLGPQAQEVIRPFLKLDANAYL